MRLTFAPRDILQIDDARIIYRNFSGAPSKFNREGDRNFKLVIDTEEMADALKERGWNVSVKPPSDEEDEPLRTLKVKIKFNDRGPNVYLVSGNRKVKLDEESVDILDNIDILGVNMDIRPFDWSMADGKSGRTAYLQSIEVIQEIDRFAERYSQED